MKPEMTIETPRLNLYGVSPDFISRLFRNQPKEEIMQFFGCSESGFERLSLMNEKGMETFRISSYSFILQRKSDLISIGECGFHTWNNTHQRAEIYYHIHSDEDKGKGYMKEALPFVIQFGFDHMNLHRIAGLLAADNLPSMRLLQQNGFVYEGIMREDYVVEGQYESSHCYSLLKHEWERNKA